MFSDPQEVKLVKKEHFNGWYGLLPYYAALTVSKLPVQISLNMIFCTTVFFMVGVPFTIPRFVMFCVIGNIISLVSEGIGMAIGSMFSVTVSIIAYIGLFFGTFDIKHAVKIKGYLCYAFF